MAATTLPRTVRNAVRVLTSVLWALAAVAAFAWDTDSLIVTLTLAAVGTGAWGFLYLAGQNDKTLRLLQDSFNERQAMLISVIEQLASGVEPEPEPERKPTGLRAVS